MRGRPRQHRPLPAAARRLPDRGLAVPARRRPRTADRRAEAPRHPPDALLPRLRRQGRDRHRRPRRLRRGVERGYVATHADGSPYVFTSNFNADGGGDRLHRPRGGALVAGAGAQRAGARRRRASCRTSASRSSRTCTSPTARRARRCTTGCPSLFHRATMKAVRRFERRHPRREIFYFTRAGYTGTPGSARYEYANFPGDETTDWTRAAGPRLADPRHAQPRRSAAPTGSRPTSAGSSTSARTSRRRRSCSCAGPSGRRCRRSSASTARSAPAPTPRGPTTTRRSRIYKRLVAATPARPRR